MVNYIDRDIDTVSIHNMWKIIQNIYLNFGHNSALLLKLLLNPLCLFKIVVILNNKTI